jgi:hypothetical protein
VYCIRTESDLSSDKFALSGSVVTKEGGTGIIVPLHRINNGEDRDLSEWSYRVESTEPTVGIVLHAMDLDENDSWPDAKDITQKAAGLISTGIAFVPGWGTTVSAIISGMTPAILNVIQSFIEGDENDLLFHYEEKFEFGPFRMDAAETTDRTVNTWRLTNSDNDAVYVMQFKVTCTSSGERLWPDGPPAMADPGEEFRSLNTKVVQENLGYVAALPTFEGFPNRAPGHGSDVYAPAVCFMGGQVEWRDVPISELDHVALDDFGARMRASNAYASRQGYVAAFPNYFHALVNNQIVCGTFLIPHETAEWKDVSLSELKLTEADLNDPVTRFVATHRYAVNHGWLSGFPNMFHATYNGVIVCGSVFFKYGHSTLRDVFIAWGPR